MGHTLPSGYAIMNDEERIWHWSGYIYRGMRWAGEDGVEPCSILDAWEREGWKQADPDLDRVLPEISAILARMWMEPVVPFIAQVNRQMGTDFDVRHPLTKPGS